MAEIFEYAIAYVESLALFEPLAPAARACGVRGLAIKLYDAEPNPVIEPNLAWLRAAGVKRLRDEGFAPGPWAVPLFKPEECATAVSKLYGELGLSFAVFETEWHYKTDGGGVDVASLLGPWRARRPRAYTACAVEGGPPTTFNHAAAQRYDARLLPENYWLQDAAYDVRACFLHARSLGWDLARVHPTLSGVEGHEMGEAIIRAYRARASGFTRGVALWRGDMLSVADYRLVGLADDLALR